MHLRSFFLTAAALLTILPAAGAATAPAIIPTGDTFVDSANPGDNYGAAGALGISATGSANGEFDTFIRFNLASTESYFNGVYGAGNWTLSSVTLQLTATAPNNPIFNSSAAGSFSILLTQSDAWVEGTGTPSAPDTTSTDLNYTNHTSYLGAGDQSLGTFSFAGGTSGTATYTLPAATLQAAAQAGSDASLYLAAADTQVSYLFNSRSFGTASSRPTLTVSAVPEPAAESLLAGAGALLGLGWIYRRRRMA